MHHGRKADNWPKLNVTFGYISDHLFHLLLEHLNGPFRFGHVGEQVDRPHFGWIYWRNILRGINRDVERAGIRFPLSMAASHADTGYGGSAVGAGSLADPVGFDGVPVALDQHARTGWAAGVLAPLAGYVALVDIAQAGGETDFASLAQGSHRCPGKVEQFVGGVELAHVPGGIDPQVCNNERCDALKVGVRIRYLFT